MKYLKAVVHMSQKIFKIQRSLFSWHNLFPAGIDSAATYLVPHLTTCPNLPPAAIYRLRQFTACRNFPCRNLPLPQLSGHPSCHLGTAFLSYFIYSVQCLSVCNKASHSIIKVNCVNFTRKVASQGHLIPGSAQNSSQKKVDVGHFRRLILRT